MNHQLSTQSDCLLSDSEKLIHLLLRGDWLMGLKTRNHSNPSLRRLEWRITTPRPTWTIERHPVSNNKGVKQKKRKYDLFMIVYREQGSLTMITCCCVVEPERPIWLLQSLLWRMPQLVWQEQAWAGQASSSLCISLCSWLKLPHIDTGIQQGWYENDPSVALY